MGDSQPVILAAAANLCWGLMPLYFAAIGPVRPEAIISMQVVTTYLLSLIIGSTSKSSVGEQRYEPMVVSWLVPALFISGNWCIYLFAMLTGNVVDAGLGYLFTPFVIIGLSRVIFQERLASRQLTGLSICVVGVVAYVIKTGIVPVFGLSLAFTFGLYATWHRSHYITNNIAALCRELSVLVPVAAIALLLLMWHDHSIALRTWLGLSLLGPLTLLPLFLFLSACRLGISAVNLGVCQLVAPAVSVAIGILFMNQPFTLNLALLLISLAAGTAIAVFGSEQRHGNV